MTPRDYEDQRREREGRWDTQQGQHGQHGQQGPPTYSISEPAQTAGASAGDAPKEVRRDSREARAARDARYLAAMAGNDQQQLRAPPGAATQPGQFGAYGASDDALGRGTGPRSGGASGSQGYGYERREDRTQERGNEALGYERRGMRAHGENQREERQEPHAGGGWDPRMGGAGRRALMAETGFDRGEALGRGDVSGRPTQAWVSGSTAGVPGLDDRSADRSGREERMRGRSSDGLSYQGSAPVQRQFDPDYHQWRADQIRKLDEEYEQWRKERFQKFSEEFDSWRKQRLSGRETQSGYSGDEVSDRAQREMRQSRDTRATLEARSGDDQRAPSDAQNLGTVQELPDAGSASAFGSTPPRSAVGSPAAHERAPERESASRSGGILSSLLGTDKNK